MGADINVGSLDRNPNFALISKYRIYMKIYKGVLYFFFIFSKLLGVQFDFSEYHRSRYRNLKKLSNRAIFYQFDIIDLNYRLGLRHYKILLLYLIIIVLLSNIFFILNLR